MARQLTAIKLKSLWSTLRAQTAGLVFAIIGYLYVAVMVVALSVAMVAGFWARVPLVPELAVSAGALCTLGWVVLPMVFTSQDATLNPVKLAPFMGPSRKLAWSLLLAGGAGVGGAYLAFFSVSYAIGWWAGFGPIAGLCAVFGAGLGVLIAFGWSRVAVGYASRFHLGRRGRERAGLIALVLLLLVLAPMGLWIGLLTSNFEFEVGPSLIASASRFLTWTPFGAPWALPAAVASGAYTQALLLALISLFTAWAGWRLWLRLLPSSMAGVPTKLDSESLTLIESGETKLPGRGGRRVQETASAEASIPFLRGAAPMLRMGINAPTAATAQRTWLYWLRDPRLSSQLITVLILMVMALVISKMGSGIDEVADIGGAAGMLAMAVFLTGMTFGTLVQYDSTALWVQLAAGIRGWEDRLGRFLGSLPLVVAVIVLGAGAFTLIAGLTALQSFATFTFLVVAFAGSFTATSVISTQWIYQVQPPGASPLSSKQTGEFWATMLLGIGQMASSILLILPAGAALLFGWFVSPSGLATAAALAFSWIYSVALIALGLYVSGRILDRSQVDLLTRMASWPGHRVQG